MRTRNNAFDRRVSRLMAFRRARDLGSSEARALQRDLPQYFARLPVDVHSLIRALDLGQRKVRSDAFRGRLVGGGDLFETEVIEVAEGSASRDMRFSQAHELGHALLARLYADVDVRESIAEQEVFADAFATALVIPESCHSDIVPRFLGCRAPRELNRLSDQIGVGPSKVLSYAYYLSTWTTEHRTLWLYARFEPNRRSGLEPGLRVRQVFCNKARYFVPTNRRLANLIGADTVNQLSGSQEPLDAHRTELLLNERETDTGRWRERRRAVELSAQRVAAANAYYVIAATIL